MVIKFINGKKKHYYLHSEALNIKKDKWNLVELDLKVPEAIINNTEIQVFIWNRGNEVLYMDNFSLQLFSSDQ
jgi:hypothetical protein